MNLSIALFATLAVCLLLGVPISFSIGISALVGLYVGGIPLTFLPQSAVTAVDSLSIMAIPFFILAGSVMDTGGLSKRLINVASSLVGNVTGGFGMVTVISCAFFAAICGSSPATVAAIGAIMIPAMIKRGYSVPTAAAISACAGGLGIIIPPSVNMVIYGVTAGVSISDMFLAGFLPGLLIVFALCLLNFFIAKKKHIAKSGIHFSFKSFLRAVWDAKWALLAPVLILGGIYSGWFTPTESAVVAVIYGVIIGTCVYKELKWADIPRILAESATTTGSIVIILGLATAFGRLVSLYQIPQQLAAGMAGVSQNPYILLLMIAGVIFILGMFMETLSIMIILTPIFLPIVKAAGVDPIHFGMVMVLGAEIGMMTPPVGVNIFVASGISGGSLERISRSILPFIFVMAVIYLMIILVPQISTFLPSIIG